MKKITLLLLLPFAAVLSVFSQSTFTILPKFQVGDTLVYNAVDNTNDAVHKVVPNTAISSRDFYLIVKVQVIVWMSSKAKKEKEKKNCS